MKKKLLTILMLSFALFFSCNNVEEEISILDENFDSNTKGWIQEDAEFHKLEIKDGYYFIESKDSGFYRTSSYSLDKSYLYSLPEEYSIETSIEIIESDLDTAYCGLILESNSFEYEFRLFETGEVWVNQYNYSTKEYTTYNSIELLKTNEKIRQFNVQIKVNGWRFMLYVNNEKLGGGKMSSKSWSRLTPFAGRLTSIKVDYLYIK